MIPSTDSKVAQQLNRSCYCTSADIPALQRWLEQDLADRGLAQPIVATHPHLFAAAPVFVAQAHVDQMQALIDAVETTIARPAYRDIVLADAPAIARHPPAARGGLLSYDFHITDAGPRLIEINTNAGGAMLNAALARAQRVCCAEVEQMFNGRDSGEALEQALFATFIAEWRRARGDAPLQNIAIVDDTPEQQYLYPEFMLFERLFEAHGIASVITSPQALRWEGDALWHDGRRVDMAYNRLTDFYFADPAHSALRYAYERDSAVVSPHPHAHALYANKRNLAVLSNEGTLRTLGASDDAVSQLLRGIPPTLALSDRSEERWWMERKRWFFKPSVGYGSRGSYRGDKLTRKTLAAIVQDDYVAQALVPPSERSLRGEPGQRPLKLDLRCYVYAGATLSLAARLYQGQTTNMRTPGGGFAPVYVTPAPVQAVTRGNFSSACTE
jgi:hypothetical protein